MINRSTFINLSKVRSLMLHTLARVYRTFLHIKRWTGEKIIIIKNAKLIRMPKSSNTRYTLRHSFNDMALSHYEKEIFFSYIRPTEQQCIFSVLCFSIN